MVIYTRDPRRNGQSENPGAENGWNYTIYEYDAGRVGDVRVLEAPGEQNGWKKMVLRSERRSVSLIVIDWELAARPAK
jgi:hypothetical protein